MDVGEITPKEVRQALAKLRHARSLRGCPLAEMSAIHRLLQEEGVPVSAGSLGWALGVALYELTVTRLTHLRGLESSLEDLSPAEEASRLARDFRCGSVKLEAWSALYYRFLCPNLQLRTGELVDIALPQREGRSGHRLFQRRVQSGVRELTALLRDLESSARRTAPAVSMPDEAPRSCRYLVAFGSQGYRIRPVVRVA